MSKRGFDQIGPLSHAQEPWWALARYTSGVEDRLREIVGFLAIAAGALCVIAIELGYFFWVKP